jgi:MEMO1 family protein
VVYGALLPHAPILVPGVGGLRQNDAALTIVAMRKAAGRALAADADTLLVVSPHSPGISQPLGIWGDERLRGSLKRFGCPSRTVDLPADTIFAEEIAALSPRVGLKTVSIIESCLDHGAMVPLWFMAEAGWSGPTVVLGLNSLDQEALVGLGEVIAQAAVSCGRRVTLIASGDMSHRLTADAPLGYDPRGLEFDLWLVERLQRGNYRDVLKLDPELGQAAAQDAIAPLLVVFGAVGFSTLGAELLNYAGPFGVGYGVAILYCDGMRPVEA